jgi:hypothetical protein
VPYLPDFATPPERFAANQSIGAALLAMAPLLAPSVATAAPTPRTCTISDNTSLGECLKRAAEYDRFVLEADLQCSTGANSCPADQPLIALHKMSNKEIDGQGHAIRRQVGQRKNPVISIYQSGNITVKNLVLDEDQHTPPCELSERDCASTVSVQESKNVTLDSVKVQSGKGYVVRVWATDGFTFTRGSITDAGIIGLYVGHYQYGPSANVAITDSTIAHSRTNGIVVQGAYSNDRTKPVLIANNTIRNNHWHGLWPIPGGVTTGGQILIGSGRNIRVTGNTVEGGHCDNCYRSQHVTAVEIGDVAPPPAGSTDLTIDHNVFRSPDGKDIAIWQNVGSTLSGITVEGNRATGFANLIGARVPIRQSGNTVDPSPQAR